MKIQIEGKSARERFTVTLLNLTGAVHQEVHRNANVGLTGLEVMTCTELAINLSCHDLLDNVSDQHFDELNELLASMALQIAAHAGVDVEAVFGS